LFGLAYEKGKQALKQIEHRWSHLVQTLQETDENDFLKVYWTSRHGLTQLNEVYDAVKTEIKSGAQAEDLSIDMLEAAEGYAAIDDPEDPIWASTLPTHATCSGD
jgi:arginine decarboxylase-like protein